MGETCQQVSYARRVKGVQGIFNAHKRCAELAYTKSFYVVDADADLEDDFDFVIPNPANGMNIVSCVEM